MDWYNDLRSLAGHQADRIVELERKIGDLSRENMKLRQQRDAANAQLDFILENLNNESTRNTGKGR